MHEAIRRLIVVACGALMMTAAAYPSPGVAEDWASHEENTDPLEKMNRGVFWFNDKVDVYALEPVAKGWHWLMPDRVERSVANFFTNLRFPIHTVNSLLQGKLKHTGVQIGRFVVNSTVGIAGFFDPATDWGLPLHREDFGQTLGYWGVGPGPYLVLPLLGASTIRDTVGLAGDACSTVYPWFVPWLYSLGPQAINTVNSRAEVIDDVREIKEASVDYYAAVRNGFLQHRDNEVHDRSGMSEQEKEELYEIEE